MKARPCVFSSFRNLHRHHASPSFSRRLATRRRSRPARPASPRPQPITVTDTIPDPLETPSATSHMPARTRRYVMISCLLVLPFSAYLTNLYTRLSRSPPHIPGDSDDPSAIYDLERTISTYDEAVDSTEYWSSITRVRKQLVSMATGNVLEVGAGTGRNGEFYDWGEVKSKGWFSGALPMLRDKDGVDEGAKIQSITFIDQSPGMLRIARHKWEEKHPGTSDWTGPPPPPSKSATSGDDATKSNQTKTKMLKGQKLQSQTEAKRIHFESIPASQIANSNSKSGIPEGVQYDTIIETFALCSLPDPLGHVRSLLTLLSAPSKQPTFAPSISNEVSNLSESSSGGRIFLLEHGRVPPSGSFVSKIVNYILDRGAVRHASRWGCWWNRDLDRIIDEAVARGWLVVERRERMWFSGFGTVLLLVGRRGPNA